MKRLTKIFHYIVIKLFLLCLLLNQAWAYNLPEMGDSSARVISRVQEERLGDEIMLQVREFHLYNTDPVIADYVQTLGERLAAASTYAPEDFDFFVINDSRVNAFALPGGHIGINSGLILVAQSEDEVASVMAHEIAHVTQRHIARMIERSQNLSWPMLAMILGSMILATQSAAAGSGAMAGAMAGSMQDMINFTRSNEEEADRIGMDMLSKAQYNPHAMASFFARMAQANKYNDSFYVPDFLRTHPVTITRVADASSRAQHYPAVQTKNSLSFHLIRQRLQINFAKSNQDLLGVYRAKLAEKGESQNAIVRYGYSLALEKKGLAQDAIKELQQLRAQDPKQKIYILSLADIYQNQHQYTAGISVLQEGLKLYPDDKTMVVQMTQMMINANQFQQAKTVLSRQLRYGEKNPQYYRLLAQAESEMKNMQASHMANAEYYALQNDLHSAVRELKRAQQLQKNNDYTQAKIASRLRELEADLEFLDL